MIEIPLADASARLADVVDAAREAHDPVYLTRGDRRVAAVVDADVLDRLIAAADGRACSDSAGRPHGESAAGGGGGATSAQDGNTLAGLVRDADDVRSIQRRLDETTIRFSALIGSVQFAVLVEDQDRRIVLTNRAFTELFDIPAPPEALVGADCAQAAEESKHLFADPEGFVASVERALAARVPVADEELHMRDGRALARYYVPVFSDGQYLGHLWLYRDVTAARAAQLEISRSRAELAEAQRVAHVGSWTFDPVADVAEWSDEMRTIFGLASDDPTPSFAQERRFSDPLTGAELVRLMTQCMTTGEPYVFAYDITRPDGSLRHVLARGEAVRNTSGAIVSLRGTVADVTELHETDEALRASEARYRLLAENTSDVVMLVGIDGIMQWVSPASRETLDWEPHDLVGRRNVDLIHPDDLTRLAPIFSNAAATGAITKVAFRFRCGDGRFVWVEAVGQEVPATANQPAARVVRMRDIDAQQKALISLAASEEALRAADEAKNAFISTLSHELRNPLAAIILAVDNVRDAVGDDPTASWALGIAERQSQHMARLVDDLLDITRVTRGTMTLQTEPVGLNELVWHIANDNQAFFNTRSVTLEVRTSPIPIRLDADPARLVQAIGNLLHNAAKFSHPGGTVMLTVDTDTTHSQAVITITDTGVGIDPQILPDLFEPFVQAQQNLDRSAGGLGLGLAVVKQIITLHGGTVTATSQGPGHGSQFTITLPLASNRAQPASPLPTTLTEARRMRVLLIEDDPMLQEVTTHILMHLGHEAALASTGPDGITAALQNPPDVILCDIGLPGMTGYDVARAIKANATLNQIPLVALTGYATPQEIAAALDAGFDAHVAKPIDSKTLETTLGALTRAQHPS